MAADTFVSNDFDLQRGGQLGRLSPIRAKSLFRNYRIGRARATAKEIANERTSAARGLAREHQQQQEYSCDSAPDHCQREDEHRAVEHDAQ
jgi:hypothetical protein